MQKLPTNNGLLGKEIKISPKSHVSMNTSGFKIEFFTPTVDVLIGIGKDHVAYLLMDEDAWKALNKGEKIHISTLKEYKKQFVNPKKIVMAAKRKSIPSRNKTR